MAETFLISDTHFGHANSLTFKRDDGSPLRAFSSCEEMDEHMVSQWNSVVRPNDKVIHLGDVVINKKFLPILNRLNGKKKLVCGNHDIFPVQTYLEYFYDVKAYRVFDKFIFSHIPVHKSSIGRFRGNVHGHLHSGQVMLDNGQIDPYYVCCCVEQPHINYTPTPWYVIKEIFEKRGI